MLRGLSKQAYTGGSLGLSTGAIWKFPKTEIDSAIPGYTMISITKTPPRVPLIFGNSYTLGLQIAQSRSYLYTLRPKVGIIYILGAMGVWGYQVDLRSQLSLEAPATLPGKPNDHPTSPAASSPELPLKTPQVPSSKEHKPVDRGTLESSPQQRS